MIFGGHIEYANETKTYAAQLDHRGMMCTKSECKSMLSSSLGITIARQENSKQDGHPGGHIEYANETKTYAAQLDHRGMMCVSLIKSY